MNLINLKYWAEAVFLLGVAFRLLRWALSALADGDAPPSAFVDDGIRRQSLELTLTSSRRVEPTTGSSPSSTRVSRSSLATPLLIMSDTMSRPLALGALGKLGAASENLVPPPRPGDPALFPQAMLDAMTPEQRAQVLGTLAKQRTGETPTLSSSQHSLDPALFPQSMLDAMTPEQRAQVLSSLAKQRAGGAGG